MYQISAPNDVPLIKVTSLDSPAHVFVIETERDEKTWYHDIKFYLQTQQYPSGASNKDKKTLRRLSGISF